MPLTLKFAHFRWSARWSMTLLTAIAVAAFIDLGHWQWQRAQQTRALAEHFRAGTERLIDLEEQPISALPRFAQVRVQGRLDGAHQFLLDNMSYQGMPGYEVLTPLTLADGRALIVNRGWVPLSVSREHLPDVRLMPAPLQTLVGRLDNLPVPGISLGHAPPSAGPSWPKLTSFPTMADLASALGRPLEPRQLLLDANQPQGFVRDWHPPGMSFDQHLSYAVQWWGFATVALLLYAVLNRRKTPA